MARRRPSFSPSKRVLITGCGAVGSHLIRSLQGDTTQYEVVGVFIRDRSRYPTLSNRVPVFDDARVLERSDPDILIDVTSGAGFPELVSQALMRGVDVVSVNARVVAQNFHATIQKAEVSGAKYKYGACVSGACDVLEFIRQTRAKSPITTVHLTNSGVASCITSSLSHGLNLQGAKSEACERGASYRFQADALGYERQRAIMDLVAHAAFGTTLTNLFPTIEMIDTKEQAREIKSQARFHPVMTLERKETGVGAKAVFLADAPHLELEATREGKFGVAIYTENNRTHSMIGEGLGPKAVVSSILADLVTLNDQRKASV